MIKGYCGYGCCLWNNPTKGIIVESCPQIFESDENIQRYKVRNYKNRRLCNLILNKRTYETEIQRTYHPNNKNKLVKDRISKEYMHLIKVFISDILNTRSLNNEI